MLQVGTGGSAWAVCVCMKGFSVLAAVLGLVVIAAAQTATTHSPARKYSFAFVGKDGSTTSWGDWSDFKDLPTKSTSDRLFVKKDGAMYEVTDANTISTVNKALGPTRALGKQQGELGRKQGELGKQQGELGRQQGQLGRRIGEIARSQGNEAEMKEISGKMQELGEQQAALGKRQEALGGQQAELGKKQHEASKAAEETITKLLDTAFSRGWVKKV
jgi:hypothetical protein